MKERIKMIRDHFKMSRKAFAEKLKLSDNFIYFIEKGEREVSERTIADICRVFDVNEEWLKTGNGEMFIQKTEEDELAVLFGSILGADSTDDEKRLASAYASLTLEERKQLAKIMVKLAKKIK